MSTEKFFIQENWREIHFKNAIVKVLKEEGGGRGKKSERKWVRRRKKKG